MCLYGGVSSIPFSLICNMTTSVKIIVLTFDSTPGVEGVCKDIVCACIVLYVQFPLISYAT